MPVSSQEIFNANQEALYEKHPCFNKKSRHAYGRIHLPVAPRCNVQCNFCNRKYSCVNESRPGVTASVMSPGQALEHLNRSLERIPSISVVGIAGPGDPFANPQETLETLRLVRANFPDLMLCVSSNGLNVLPYLNDLTSLKVSHVTITVNAVDPAIGSQIYDWINWNTKTLRARDAASLLWENQQLAIQALDFRDILVKVNSVCIPGVNSCHIDEIARTVSRLGASLHNVIPLLPIADTAFANLEEPSPEEIKVVRLSAQRFLPQMEHCSRCRADAVGILGESNPSPVDPTMQFSARMGTIPISGNNPHTSAKFNGHRPYVAVASQEGVQVNVHLGKAETLRIYEPGDSKPLLVDVRPTPGAGGGKGRWLEMAELLQDCAYLLVSGAGPVPKSTLSESGIRVKIVEGFIEDIITQLAMTNGEITENGFHCGTASCRSSSHQCGQDAKACNGATQGCQRDKQHQHG